MEQKAGKRLIGRLAGPILAIFTVILMGMEPAGLMAGVAVLMAVWWITEALPLAATALLPLPLFPLLGIMSGRAVAPVYMNSTIFLFIGGFLIALAMERQNLHKRMALGIIHVLGGGPSRLVLGFLVSSAFLSMWISNTATAIMMLPIGMAIISRLEAMEGVERVRPITLSLLLSIAYGCSLGGIATLVGTPPNLAFSRILALTFPEAPPISFGSWILMGLPLSVLLLGLTWLLLTKCFFPVPKNLNLQTDAIAAERTSLGPMSFAEKAVAAVFASTAVLWVFRNPLTLGEWVIPGWSGLLPHGQLLDDGTVSLAMASLLFLIPARDGSGKALAGPEIFSDVPWSIVLLFGGGFALAKGFQDSGLTQLIGAQFQGLAGTPSYPVIAVICTGLTFLTELTSNTATTEMILPPLASVAVAMEMDPLLLMVPATLSASCAFMMPVATPPNAIVFGSGRITVREMASVGIYLNLVGILVISTFVYFAGGLLLGIETGGLPDWAK